MLCEELYMAHLVFVIIYYDLSKHLHNDNASYSFRVSLYILSVCFFRDSEIYVFLCCLYSDILNTIDLRSDIRPNVCFFVFIYIYVHLVQVASAT